MKLLITCLLMVSFVLPSFAWAKKGHHGGHHHDVVVVKHKKKRHHHHHDDHHYSQNVVVVNQPQHHYHRSRLPEIATFAVIAGASYAIVENVFYKKSGDNYVYAERPANR
ncbi:hypothetical protein [Photobacterium sp.]|uniref:hypothetical protein n=1 Tax=Photobacterium sp. TaxID=660 RepID=UPI00299E86F1|nr:hypothetical protein [Photobacterium sp.]MDX1304364.1 hypothetical protein [Photobacterium sp.]